MESDVRPIVVHLGKAPKKQLARLRRGEGKLAAEVQEVIAELRRELGAEAEGKDFVPVVVVYRKRKKSAPGLKW